MTLEEIREYCLNKKAVTEHFHFDEETLVFKVLDKVFLLTNINDVEISVNLKCNTELAIELREKYSSVQPGYHMNKKHWNTVITDGRTTDREIMKMIDHSYELIVQGLSKKQRELLENSD